MIQHIDTQQKIALGSQLWKICSDKNYQTLFCALYNGQIQVYNLGEDGKYSKAQTISEKYTSHYYNKNLQFDKENKNLIFVSGNTEIKIFRKNETGQYAEVQQLDDHSTNICDIHVDGSSKQLFSGSESGKVISWSLQENGIYIKTQEMEEHKNTIYCIEYYNESKKLFTGSRDKKIIVWDYDLENKKYKKSKILKGHTNEVNSLFYCPITKTLFSASDDKTIRVWQHQGDWDFNTQQVLTGHLQCISQLLYIHDQRHLVSCGFNNEKIIFWAKDKLNNKFVKVDELQGSSDDFCSFVYSKDQRLLIYGGVNETLKFFEMSNQFRKNPNAMQNMIFDNVSL